MPWNLFQLTDLDYSEIEIRPFLIFHSLSSFWLFFFLFRFLLEIYNLFGSLLYFRKMLKLFIFLSKQSMWSSHESVLWCHYNCFFSLEKDFLKVTIYIWHEFNTRHHFVVMRLDAKCNELQWGQCIAKNFMREGFWRGFFKVPVYFLINVSNNSLAQWTSWSGLLCLKLSPDTLWSSFTFSYLPAEGSAWTCSGCDSLQKWDL